MNADSLGNDSLFLFFIYVFAGGWGFGIILFIYEPSVPTFIAALFGPVFAVLALFFPPWFLFVTVGCFLGAMLINADDDANI